jgi:hypothetical protein
MGYFLALINPAFYLVITKKIPPGKKTNWLLHLTAQQFTDAKVVINMEKIRTSYLTVPKKRDIATYCKQKGIT